MKTFINIISDVTGITENDLKSGNRKFDISHPRQIAMHAIYRLGKSYSLHYVAKIFNKDHTTVMHGIKNAERLMSDFLEYRHLESIIYKSLMYSLNRELFEKEEKLKEARKEIKQKQKDNRIYHDVDRAYLVAEERSKPKFRFCGGYNV